MPNLSDLLSTITRTTSVATGATISVQLATITAADPVHQIYEALPVGSTASNASKQKAIPLNAHSTVWGGTQAHRVYRQGDLVLLATQSTDLAEASQTLWSVILGTVNASKFKYIDREMKPMKARISADQATDYSRFYDDINKLYEVDKRFADIGFYLPGLANASGGDYIIRGDNTLLRVSDSIISSAANGVFFSLGGVTKSLVTSAITKSEQLVGSKYTHRLLNGDAYIEHMLSMGGDALRVSNTATRGVLEQYGSVAYGKRTAVVLPSATLSTVDHRLDGQVRVTTVGGFISDKVVAPETFKQAYRGLVVSDNSVSETSSQSTPNSAKIRQPFDKVLASSNWQKISKGMTDVDLSGDDWLFDTTVDLRSTYYCPYPTEDASDGGWTKLDGAVTVAKCGSRLAQCPDGSIILRDAWGSEIRLSNGDVQISAARKLVFISSDDTLAVVGGTLSTSCGGDIQIGSAKTVDVSATEELNLATKSAIMTAEDRIILHGTNSLQLHSDNSICIEGRYLYADTAQGTAITSTGEITINSEDNVAMCSLSAYVAVGSSVIELASSRTNILSDVSISSGVVTHSGMAESDTMSMGGGSLTVSGSFVCGGQITTNEGISAKSGIFANSVTAKIVDPYIGVFQSKSKIKERPMPEISAGYNKRKPNKEAREIIFDMLTEYTIKALRNSMYKAVKSVTALVKPLFSRSRGVGRAPIRPASIANGYGEVYIYPGRQFWTASGMVDLVPREIESLTVKQELRIEGATNLFLYNQEEQVSWMPKQQ